jgi:protein TonB
LFQAIRAQASLLTERVRPDFGRRATGVAVALALEGGLLLLLLTLGMAKDPHREVPLAVVAFDAKEYTDEAEAEQAATQRTDPQPPAQAARPAPQPSPRAAEIAGQQPTRSFIELPSRAMAELDISKLPKKAAPAPAGPAYGPAFTPRFGDSQRVGTAPNGQPMYAASWYREPTDQELRGYLSTAGGPGWALITCKTVADYRVEDCVGLGEYPQGSNIERSVLAAAWQFRVRPPRINGVSQVGDWVRIRITYTIDLQGPAAGPANY